MCSTGDVCQPVTAVTQPAGHRPQPCRGGHTKAGMGEGLGRIHVLLPSGREGDSTAWYAENHVGYVTLQDPQEAKKIRASAPRPRKRKQGGWQGR